MGLGFHELINPDRLADVIAHARAYTIIPVSFQGIGYNSYYLGALRPAFFDLSGSLQAVPVGHPYTHTPEDHIVGLALQGLEDLQAVGCYIGPVTQLRQNSQGHLLV